MVKDALILVDRYNIIIAISNYPVLDEVKK